MRLGEKFSSVTALVANDFDLVSPRPEQPAAFFMNVSFVGCQEQDREMSAPNPVQHVRCDEIDHTEANRHHGSDNDQRNNAQPFGFQHLMGKSVPKRR